MDNDNDNGGGNSNTHKIANIDMGTIDPFAMEVYAQNEIVSDSILRYGYNGISAKFISLPIWDTFPDFSLFLS